MSTTATPTADDLLHALAGPQASFRPHQREAIDDLVDERRRVLCVQRTGWGKSAVYFIATAMLRARGEGPTLLISPLLALMRNQIDQATRLGLKAHTVNSTNKDDWDNVREMIERDEVDLLLISPERLNNRRFRETMLPHVAQRTGLLVIDEAHCVSDWGHDFRPDYRRIRDALTQLRPETAVLCTTATANDRVVADVMEQLQAGARDNELRTYRGELARQSLRLETVTLPSQAERLAWLARWLPEMPGSGIVYCLTKRDTEQVAEWLNANGISALAYSGEVQDEQRQEVERQLLANDVKAVVATSALGMGYDKPDLGFVVHYQAPGSAIAYYQQVGRAGRALSEAHAVLLRGLEDRDIQDYFIASAFPPREKAETVVEMIASAEKPVKLGELSSAVNLGQQRITAMLKVLDVEGAVVQDASNGWVRTREHWQYDAHRYDQVTALRRREQDAMERYGLEPDACLMRTLQQELDDPLAEDCGRCAACAGPRFDEPLDRMTIVAAQEHLRSRPLELDPRKKLPPMNGAPGKQIRADRQLRPGRALARSGDGGWDPLVREGRFQTGRFADELVPACVRVVDGWGPDPMPEWVTAVPSLRQPELVPDFGRRLASALGLPYLTLLERVKDGPPQREMENSSQQAANLRGQFAVVAAPPSSAGLLFDDLWFSGWTLASLGAQLREAGAGPLHPLVLSLAGR